MKIIADFSLNWQSLDDILRMIESVQCDVVKLQYYSEYDLYGSGSKDTKLQLEWMPVIKEACKAKRRKLICTVFNPDHVDLINPYVTEHKIASSEITDRDLIWKIKAAGKPVIISCGGATMNQIENAYGHMKSFGLPITLMACDVEYPSKHHNIRKMLELKNKFPLVRHGYSDHSLDIESMPILCRFYQAYYLEKHVKSDFMSENYEPHALCVSEFNEMIAILGGTEPEFIKNPHQRYLDKNLKKWVRPRV
jgi:sialic acid synthase SpsE